MQPYEFHTPIVMQYIKDLNLPKNSMIIDAGCGYNVYKQFFNNLIGFDKHKRKGCPDIVCDFLSAPFEEEVADLVLVLGSNQYNSLELIKENFIKAWSWVKPGGYMLIRFSLDNIEYRVAEQKGFFLNTNRIPLSNLWMLQMRQKLNAEHVKENFTPWPEKEENIYSSKLLKGYKLWRKPNV